jgi:long-chain alkane monooxygenase
MTALGPQRIILSAFTMNCVSHIQQGLWRREESRQLEYTSLDPWVELAQVCESGFFDVVFFADVMGVYDTHGGSGAAAIRTGMQTPVNDPMLMIPAMAAATENVGFAFTSSVYQAHPFTFARQISTLDHLSNGRIGWNVVTGYLENAARSLGEPELPPHDERYERAEEYLDVVYKLWEGSWEDGAVLADRTTGVYADPTRVHPIDHHGQYYDVAGPHLSEPSPQRTPVLFQAGSSERGRDFAAKHAEGAFTPTSRSDRPMDDLLQRAHGFGRGPGDLAFIGGVSPIVGGTEAEAKEKEEAYLEQLSVEAGLVHMSGNVGVDLSSIDPDRPLEELHSEGVQGIIKSLLDSAPPGTRTFGDLIRANIAGQFLTGSAEQVADTLERRAAKGVTGFNIVTSILPGTIVDFVEGVVPILQERGLVQTEYAEGPLRQKLFGHPRLPDTHPAARYRR